VRGGGGRGAEKSYDRKKAWSSINQSIFSALYNLEGKAENVQNSALVLREGWQKPKIKVVGILGTFIDFLSA
jgi:hypothetical protein